jgi:hypothetical protein
MLKFRGRFGAKVALKQIVSIPKNVYSIVVVKQLNKDRADFKLLQVCSASMGNDREYKSK